MNWGKIAFEVIGVWLFVALLIGLILGPYLNRNHKRYPLATPDPKDSGPKVKEPVYFKPRLERLDER